ncbi:hypothetical protein HMPREF0970_00540 [Schaalia odontolytica F0309]|uniref:Uncharacterized protein n=1 Tax=Schaalia odontolytica F0309 TaxID=649742 RepID=D4TX83_9ACTO|nr:hypothetical protein HMPREF0970_00540 [Schaalia odontolytica F0309]
MQFGFHPSRFEATPLTYRGFRRSLKFGLRELHAKFSGARCFLTRALARARRP